MLNANDDRGKKVPSRMVYIYVMFIVFIRGANNFLHMFFFFIVNLCLLAVRSFFCLGGKSLPCLLNGASSSGVD